MERQIPVLKEMCFWLDGASGNSLGETEGKNRDVVPLRVTASKLFKGIGQSLTLLIQGLTGQLDQPFLELVGTQGKPVVPSLLVEQAVGGQVIGAVR